MQRKKWISLLLVMVLLFSSSVTVAATKPDTAVTRVQEVTSLRETNSETYLMSDGTYQCVVYAEDKYYEDSAGSLQLIDNSIKLDTATVLSAEKQYVNTANTFDVSFSESSTPQISIGLEGKSVTFSPLSATGGNSNIISTKKIDLSLGKVNNCDILNELACTGSNTVTYSDVFYNTDLVYVLDNAALKEYIILENENAPNAFSFLFSMDGLTMQTGEDTAAFRDAAGKDVFALDSLFAIDSNGVQTGALTYTFTPFKDTGKMIVTVTLDPEYLAAADRAFPVVIDPTIMISSSETADSCVSQKNPNTNYYLEDSLRTGNDSVYGIRRSYIKFNIPSSITAGSVTSARLDIQKANGATPTIKAYRCTGSWSSSTITWNNKPGYSTAIPSPTCTPYSTGSTWFCMDVTASVQSWVNGTYTNFGFVLIDNVENDPNHWTLFYSSDAVSPHKPELYINYLGYLGCKAYVQNNSSLVNCHGYAFFTNTWPTFIEDLGYKSAFLSKNTSAELLTLVKEAMEIWLDANFYGKWDYGSLNSVLQEGQWLVAMRTGVHNIELGKVCDYHFWYRTNTGVWANKHGKLQSELLPASDLPTTNTSSGWSFLYGNNAEYEYVEFYDSAIIYYIVSE